MAKKIIRLTEADLTRLVQRVIKEQSEGINLIKPCAELGVKSPGKCDTKRKSPIASCASLGVKTPGTCYVDTKKPVPGLPTMNDKVGKTLTNKIKEQKSSRPLITEAAAQMAIDDAEERMASGEKPDPKIMTQIKQCITTKQLTSLGFLTTSAGAYALGIIAMLISNPVGFAVGGVLALTSIIVMFITGLPEDQGGLGADPSKDVKALLSCIKL